MNKRQNMKEKLQKLYHYLNETPQKVFLEKESKEIRDYFYACMPYLSDHQQSSYLLNKMRKLSKAFDLLNCSYLKPILFGEYGIPILDHDYEEDVQEHYHYDFPDDKKIKEDYQKFEKQYGHPFKDAQVVEKFKKIFTLTKFVGDFIEFTNDDELALLHAYKLLVYFHPTNDAQINIDLILKNYHTFVSQHNLLVIQKSLHDALVNNIPVYRAAFPLQLTDWQMMILEKGRRATRLFAIADKIEAKMREESSALKMLDEKLSQQEEKIDDLTKRINLIAVKLNQPQISFGHVVCLPQLSTNTLKKRNAYITYTSATALAKKITFPNAGEYPELAELCSQYNVPAEVFEECLRIRKRIKTEDNLPKIEFDGAKANRPGYWLVKLPIDDPRAYILGYITNCCQSIGNNAWRCVEDGLTKKSNGLYVLLKEKKLLHSTQKNLPIIAGKINYQAFDLVGQAYAWLSCTNNLVFDSWENFLPLRDDAPVVDILLALGEELITVWGYSQFHIGKGGQTPSKLLQEKNCALADANEYMLEGYSHGDTREQIVIAKNTKKQKALVDELENICLKAPLSAIPTLFKDVCEYLSPNILWSQKRFDEMKNLLISNELWLVLNENAAPISNYKLLKQFGFSWLLNLLNNNLLTQTTIHTFREFHGDKQCYISTFQWIELKKLGINDSIIFSILTDLAACKFSYKFGLHYFQLFTSREFNLYLGDKRKEQLEAILDHLSELLEMQKNKLLTKENIETGLVLAEGHYFYILTVVRDASLAKLFAEYFLKHRHWNYKDVIPFLLSSEITAFLGGMDNYQKNFSILEDDIAGLMDLNKQQLLVQQYLKMGFKLQDKNKRKVFWSSLIEFKKSQSDFEQLINFSFHYLDLFCPALEEYNNCLHEIKRLVPLRQYIDVSFLKNMSSETASKLIANGHKEYILHGCALLKKSDIECNTQFCSSYQAMILDGKFKGYSGSFAVAIIELTKRSLDEAIHISALINKTINHQYYMQAVILLREQGEVFYEKYKEFIINDSLSVSEFSTAKNLILLDSAGLIDPITIKYAQHFEMDEKIIPSLKQFNQSTIYEKYALMLVNVNTSCLYQLINRILEIHQRGWFIENAETIFKDVPKAWRLIEALYNLPANLCAEVDFLLSRPKYAVWFSRLITYLYKGDVLNPMTKQVLIDYQDSDGVFDLVPAFVRLQKAGIYSSCVDILLVYTKMKPEFVTNFVELLIKLHENNLLIDENSKSILELRCQQTKNDESFAVISAWHNLKTHSEEMYVENRQLILDNSWSAENLSLLLVDFNRLNLDVSAKKFLINHPAEINPFYKIWNSRDRQNISQYASYCKDGSIEKILSVLKKELKSKDQLLKMLKRNDCAEAKELICERKLEDLIEMISKDGLPCVRQLIYFLKRLNYSYYSLYLNRIESVLLQLLPDQDSLDKLIEQFNVSQLTKFICVMPVNLISHLSLKSLILFLRHYQDPCSTVDVASHPFVKMSSRLNELLIDEKTLDEVISQTKSTLMCADFMKEIPMTVLNGIVKQGGGVNQFAAHVFNRSLHRQVWMVALRRVLIDERARKTNTLSMQQRFFYGKSDKRDQSSTLVVAQHSVCAR